MSTVSPPTGEKEAERSRDGSSETSSKATLPDAEKAAPAAKDAAPDTTNPWHPSQFPEGGAQAWLVVTGAFFGLFCSFGWINCIGIFQDYYQTHQLSNLSPSTISWIASLELALMFGGNIITGRIYDKHGPFYLLVVGTFFHVLGLMMMSISTEYYQILLSQGVCSPLGISCLFTPCVAVTSTWFHKRRAFAVGIVTAGSSLGGVIFPIMINHLIPEVGFGWAIRIAAFLILGLLTFSIFTCKSRVPPAPMPRSAWQYVKPLTEVPFLLVTIASFIFYLGIFLPINFIQIQAITDGMSPDLAQYLIPILNGASLFGRIGSGWIGDRFGRFNAQVIICAFTGIITLAIWLPASGNAPLIVFSALYGLGSGCFVSLLPAMLAQISELREIGVRLGTEFAILAIGALIANPIGGAFITRDHGRYTDLQIWTGVCLLAGTVMYAAARVSLTGSKLAAKV